METGWEPFGWGWLSSHHILIHYTMTIPYITNLKPLLASQEPNRKYDEFVGISFTSSSRLSLPTLAHKKNVQTLSIMSCKSMGKKGNTACPNRHYLMSFAWGWFSIKTYQDIVVLAFSLLTQVITLNVNKNPHDSDPRLVSQFPRKISGVCNESNAIWQPTLAQLSRQPEILPSYQCSLPTTNVRYQQLATNVSKVNFAIEFVRKTYDIWINDEI